jgi:alpha-tubulin suppressor-like RCC1 family protein
LIAGNGTLWTWGSAESFSYVWTRFGRTPTAFFPANRPAKVNDDTDWLTVAAVRTYASGFESGKRALKKDGSMWLIEHTSVSQVLFDGPDAGFEPDTDWAATGGELALKKDGTLWMSDVAITTLSTGIDVYTTPTTNWTKISPENDWARLAFGGSCCLAIRNVGADGGGSLWAWGNNSAGQLGLNDIVNRIVPEQVMFDGPDEDLLPDTDWTWVAISGRFAFAGKTDGSVWTWGTSTWGQFGPGLADGPYLQPIPLAGDWAAVMMNGGGYSNHAFGVDLDGQLYGWGPNSTGELGLGYRGDGMFDIYATIPLPTLVADFSTFYTP